MDVTTELILGIERKDFFFFFGPTLDIWVSHEVEHGGTDGV